MTDSKKESQLEGLEYDFVQWKNNYVTKLFFSLIKQAITQTSNQLSNLDVARNSSDEKLIQLGAHCHAMRLLSSLLDVPADDLLKISTLEGKNEQI